MDVGMDMDAHADASSFWREVMEEIVRLHDGASQAPAGPTAPGEDSAVEPVVVTRRGTTAWVELNRPAKGNAMNPALNHAMLQALDQVEADPQVRVVVLHGAGGNFSTGMDIKEYVEEADRAEPYERERVHREALAWQYDRLLAFGKPTVAMVDGYCVGAAFTVVLACDICVASDDARFVLSEVDWGAIPAGLVMHSIADFLPPRQALMYALTGRPLGGREAAEIGLATVSVPPDSLRDEVEAITRLLASKNPATLRAIKAAFHHTRGMTSRQAGDYLQAKFDQLRYTDPAHACDTAITEFLNKRLRPARVSG